MELPKLLHNWKELLWRSWVNRVLWLMFLIQLVDVGISVANNQPPNVKDVLLTGLAPLGVWLRVLRQIALATSGMHFEGSAEPTTLQGDLDDETH
jgi:hypothetical protein